jgi:hypothetical protein
MGMNRLKVGSVDPGSAPIAPPFVWVTARWVRKAVPDVWVSWRLIARGCGPLNPCAEHVAVSNLSGSASLGLMRCHGHMASCVLARCHVASCGSHRAHMMSCAYLSHLGSDVCKWYIHFDRLDEPVIMVQSKWAFGSVYDDVIFMPSIYLLSIASFHVHFDVSCNKR